MDIIRSAETAPPLADLARAEALVFDLDNTLYPHGANLWSQVDWNITDYIAEFLDLPRDEARKMQKHYFKTYGTTLNGLMTLHEVDADDFLNKVHKIDVSALDQDHVLNDALAALPGRKLIFTNGSVGHAENVLRQVGILEHFEGIFDIVAADFIPKPDERPYEKFLAAHQVNPADAVYFEDMARNLFPAKDRGMATVLVQTDHDWARQGDDDARIDYVTGNIGGFVARMADAA